MDKNPEQNNETHMAALEAILDSACKLYLEGKDEAYSLILKKGIELKEAYPIIYQDCLLWHLLAGSTVSNPTDSKHFFDFPNNEISNFILGPLAAKVNETQPKEVS